MRVDGISCANIGGVDNLSYEITNESHERHILKTLPLDKDGC